jgi:hypothetical protein
MRDYNFFSAYDKKKGLDINPKSPYFIALIIVIVAVLASAGLVIRNMVLNDQLADLNDEIGMIQASAEYQEALDASSDLDRMKEYDGYAQIVLHDFEKHDLLGTDVLDALAATMPSNTAARLISFNNETMTGDFLVPDRRTAAELLLRLEESGLFTSVYSPSLSLNDDNPGYTLTVECQMKEGELNER